MNSKQARWKHKAKVRKHRERLSLLSNSNTQGDVTDRIDYDLLRKKFGLKKLSLDEIRSLPYGQ